MEITQASYDNVAVQMKTAHRNYLKRKVQELRRMEEIGSDDDSDQQYENALSNIEPSHAREE